jgi:CheY-like chemotaxis protein
MRAPELPARQVVLVVEDEPLIRMMAVDLVENAGFLALEAGNADEAVAILESRNDIRIVFTDIDMPGSMDGMKLAAAVRDRWPPIAIIVTSGYLGEKEALLAAGRLLLSKPEDNQKVTATLHRMAV